MTAIRSAVHAVASPALGTIHRVRRRIASRPVILMYHRVTDLAFDPQLLAVSPKHFAEQLEAVRRSFTVIPLADLARALQEGRLPRRAAVITIDDGYADTLAAAGPRLTSAGVAATVFVTSGHVGSSREFWWDELERLVLQPGHLPRVVRLSAGGVSREWDLGEAADYTERDHERHRGWNVEAKADPGPRHQLYRALYTWLHALPDRERWHLLDDLRQQASLDARGRPTHRTLDERELVELAGHPLVEIGAHSATHPALGGLPVSAQAEEIAGCRAVLERLIGRPVTSFAYPHGSYTGDTLEAVARAGFVRACSSDPHAVERGTDVLVLPRIVPRDWGAAEFRRWLRFWTG